MPFVVVGAGTAFVPTSMAKDGAQQLSIASTWWKVPGWAAEAGYPGSVVLDDGIVVSADKTGATVQVALEFGGGTGTSLKQQVRLLLDGTVIATGAQVSGTAGTMSASATVDVLAGAKVTVETSTDATFQAWASTIVSGPTSYVRIS